MRVDPRRKRGLRHRLRVRERPRGKDVAEEVLFFYFLFLMLILMLFKRSIAVWFDPCRLDVVDGAEKLRGMGASSDSTMALRILLRITVRWRGSYDRGRREGLWRSGRRSLGVLIATPANSPILKRFVANIIS